MESSNDTPAVKSYLARGPLIDRTFALVSATVVVVAAIITEPGDVRETIALFVATGAYLAPRFTARVPFEAAAIVVIIAIGVMLVPGTPMEIGIFLVVIVVLEAAAEARSLTWALGVLFAATGMICVAWVVEDGFVPVPWLAACAFTFVLGVTIRQQRVLIEQLEAARRALADAAVAEERRRVARELHDLAGHTLAATLLHVTGARHVLRRDLDEAERALRDAEEVGRAGLDQVRAAVAALRTTERGTEPPLATPAELVDVVDEYRRAGLAIADSLPPDLTAMNGPVGTAIHRIASEALANVARHAPDNAVELQIELDPDDAPSPRVSLLVADHGRPARSAQSGGFGLIGMEERAHSLGGTFTAGPTDDGWQVQASIPITAIDAKGSLP